MFVDAVLAQVREHGLDRHDVTLKRLGHPAFDREVEADAQHDAARQRADVGPLQADGDHHDGERADPAESDEPLHPADTHREASDAGEQRVARQQAEGGKVGRDCDDP